MSDTSEVPEPEVCTPVTDYVLSVRSYAPFPRFGGGFEGDNRGPSTSRSATSRVAVEIMLNPQSGRIGKPMATSSGTTWLPLDIRGLAEPRVTLVSTSRIPNGVSITLDLAGSNPLVFGAPDIDLHATLWFTLERGFLRVLAALSGDRFPNAEMFVTDGRGQAHVRDHERTALGASLLTAREGHAGDELPVRGLLRRWARLLPLKVGLIVAGVASALAAAIVAYDGIWPLSVGVGLPATVLLVALAKGWPRIQLAAQVFLILELLVLGGIWPSLATLAALIALPSPVLGIVYLVKRRLPRPGEVYILVSTLLASSSLLWQAILLATRQR